MQCQHLPMQLAEETVGKGVGEKSYSSLLLLLYNYITETIRNQ